MTDQERVVHLMQIFGDPSRVADILGTDLQTVHGVMNDDGTTLPASGGGGGGGSPSPAPDPVAFHIVKEDPANLGVFISSDPSHDLAHSEPLRAEDVGSGVRRVFQWTEFVRFTAGFRYYVNVQPPDNAYVSFQYSRWEIFDLEDGYGYDLLQSGSLNLAPGDAPSPVLWTMQTRFDRTGAAGGTAQFGGTGNGWIAPAPAGGGDRTGLFVFTANLLVNGLA